jgi:hypothetical protein
MHEVFSTEDRTIINQKIDGLINRPLNAWINASKDLGIEFIQPYFFTGIDGENYKVTGLLPEFGSGKGTIIISRKDGERADLMAELTNDYFMSALNPTYYDKYNRELFVDTLSDWGWIGKGDPPEWIHE